MMLKFMKRGRSGLRLQRNDDKELKMRQSVMSRLLGFFGKDNFLMNKDDTNLLKSSK